MSCSPSSKTQWFDSNPQGRSQEISFTEARLKGKDASNAGGLGDSPPEADAIHQSHF